MLTLEKRKENNQFKREQADVTSFMRNKTARYFDYLSNGSTDVEIPIPASDLRKVSVPTTTTEGIAVTVEIWEAKFGDETVQRPEREKARQWIRSKRQLWETTGKVLRDRAVARAQVIRAQARMVRVLDEIEDVVSDDTVHLLRCAIEKMTEVASSIS